MIFGLPERRLLASNNSVISESRKHHARIEIFDYIEGWHNPHRRHSAIDYESPINFERQHTTSSFDGQTRTDVGRVT